MLMPRPETRAVLATLERPPPMLASPAPETRVRALCPIRVPVALVAPPTTSVPPQVAAVAEVGALLQPMLTPAALPSMLAVALHAEVTALP